MRHKLAVFCPETDGLLPWHRIRYVPEGKTREEKIEEIRNLELEISLPGIDGGKENVSWKLAQLVCHIYQIDGFTDAEIFQILSRKRK